MRAMYRDGEQMADLAARSFLRHTTTGDLSSAALDAECWHQYRCDARDYAATKHDLMEATIR